MAIDFQAVSIFPHYKKITVLDSEATELKLPSQCDQIQVANWTTGKTLFVGQNGCADGVAMPVDGFPVPANQAKTVKIGRGSSRANSIFVQASSGGGSIDCYIELTEL
tara:strand:- start:247 stop:570 length:324 start_codon:yes stop_codon:yes gene_type:complete